MVIEILKKTDILKVTNPSLLCYLNYSLERLPQDFDYYNHTDEYGYFSVVTTVEDITSNYIELSCCKLPSMEEQLFWEMVELVEISKSDVVEILVRVDTDKSISMIMESKILTNESRKMLNKYI